MIIQGSNYPIVIKMGEDISNASAIEIDLSYKGISLKHWSISDISFGDDNELILSLKEEETLNFVPGEYILECKYRVGSTNFFTKAYHISVAKRLDHTSLGGGSSYELPPSVILKDATVLTDILLLKGYSPYIGDNGCWYAYDDSENAFVDTGVAAHGDTGPAGPQGEQGPQGSQGPKGDPGYSPVKGVDYWTDSDKEQFIAEATEGVQLTN